MCLINNDHNNDVTFSLYSVILCITFLILYTHTDYYLHVITSYVYCTVLLTIVAHICLKVGGKISFPMHTAYQEIFAYWTITNISQFFCESVIEARCQEWRPQ